MPEPSLGTGAEKALERARSGTLAPAMPKSQTDWLETQLQACRGYFEFGSGGSTVMAARLVTGPVVAVESADEWIAALSSCQPVKSRLGDGSLRFHHADVGPTGVYGMPTKKPNWRMGATYAVEPLDGLAEAEATRIEIVLVDGRFRVACAAAARLMLPYARYIMIDDYADRPHYHVVSDVLGPHETLARAAVYPVQGESPRGLVRLLLDHLVDPR